MAQFTSSPALQARGFDAAAVQNQIQSAQDSQNRNALVQSRIQGEQADQERLTAADAQAKELQDLEFGVNILKVIASAPANRQPVMFEEGKRQYAAWGLSLEKVPQTWDPETTPGWMEERISFGKARLSALRGDKPLKPLDIVRQLEAAGIDPQSPKGQAIIVRHLEGSGQNRTAMEKNMTLVAEKLGISEPDALRLIMESRRKGYDGTVADYMGRFISNGYPPERADRMAREAADFVFERKKEEPAPEPEAEGSGFSLKKIFDILRGVFTGDAPAEEPKSKAASKSKRSSTEVTTPLTSVAKDTAAPKVSAMSREQLKARIAELKAEYGDSPPQDMVNEIDARARALGAN